MTDPHHFWDALAPHHAAIENNYLDLPSIRRMLPEIREPVLVVGAGQGLIVEELRRRGFRTDGIDLSSEMIRYAKVRRGIEVFHADARSMPFEAESYETVVHATGVIDFIADEEVIRSILRESRRVLRPSGRMLVAFYRMSPCLERFMTRVGLLQDHVLAFRRTLELYRLSPAQTLGWVSARAKVDRFRAVLLLLPSWALSTMREKRAALSMQKIFRNHAHGDSLVGTAPENQPYRDEAEIQRLFERLGIQIKGLDKLSSCIIARI